MRFILALLLSTIAFTYKTSAKNNYTDSLLKIISQSNDSLKVVNLKKLSSFYSTKNPDSAFFFAKKALQISKKNKSPYLISNAYVALADVYKNTGAYKENLDYRLLILEERLKTKDSNLIGRAYIDIGGAYYALEKNKNALEYHLKALAIFERLKNNERIAACYVNIGNTYITQNDFVTAIEYYLKAEKICDSLSNNNILSTIYNNLGALYQNLKDYKNSKIYITKSLELRIKSNDKEDIAMGYGNLGAVYSSLQEYKEATALLVKAINIYKELNNIDGIATYHLELIKLYYEIGNYDSAFYYLNQGLPLAEKLKVKNMRSHYYNYLTKLYAQKKNYERAYFYSNKLKLLTDSISSEQQGKEINELKNKYESAQKQKEIDDLEKLQLLQKLELEKQKMYKNIVILGAVFLFIIVLFFYNRYKLNKRSSELFKAHNKEITLKNKEITDSIVYAKRIQKAILPPQKLVEQYLTNGFVFYVPKDVVSGDFYWMETISSLEGGLKAGNNHTSNSPQGENLLLFAAADCTGHGVPGAMVSVICNSALNRSVREYGLLIPGEILDKTRELVVKEFEKSDEDVKDGMDISLCKIQPLSSGNYKLEWAGANNPLWIINHNSGELIEFKPNKQPIGKVDNPLPFTTHTLELQKNDTVFIFTDGFQDQFGGENGKKYKPAKMKELLLSIRQKTMPEQKEILEKTFIEWKGKLEQVDDICFIGFRV
jgi:serine phosphatase RsbU (regulator of sigma subunit)